MKENFILTNINEYLKIMKENKTFTGDEVNKHIYDITPNEDDLPEYFMNKLIKPRLFTIQKINLNDLLESDPSFKEYYNNGDFVDRYEDEDEDEYQDIDNLNLELVVVDGELLDGYNRASVLLKSGIDETYAFVANK